MATSYSTHHQPSTSLDSTSDWEYEYDDHESEDIYFTLDLTTHVPNAIQEKQYAKNGKLIGLAVAEKNAAASRSAPTTDGQTDGHPMNVEETANEANAENATNSSPSAESGKLQILDLHTKKPYVKFNNGFYSCQWFTDLGTQFWITNPGAVADPKLSGHVLDVVGSSQTRLVARPANLKRKRDAVEPEPAASENVHQPVDPVEDDASDVSDADNQPFDQDPNEPMVIPRHKIKDPHLEAQANFMARLSAIKLRKGEKDAHHIPLKMPVYYKGAHNADDLRASSHAAKTKEPQPQPAPKPSKPRSARLAESNDATEDAPPPPPPADQENMVTNLFPVRPFRRANRGGNRGGTPSHAARRANLGLELTGDPSALPPRKPTRKRGRPSNIERAARAQQEAEATTFPLDPQLAGETDDDQAQAGAASAEAETNNGNRSGSVSARSMPREGSVAASSTQGDQPRPRKGRRSKEQMEEARRLEEERKAKTTAAAAAKAGKRGSEATVDGQQRRRSARRSLEMNLDGAAGDDSGEGGAGNAGNGGQGGEDGAI